MVRSERTKPEVRRSDISHAFDDAHTSETGTKEPAEMRSFLKENGVESRDEDIKVPQDGKPRRPSEFTNCCEEQ